MSRAKSVLCLDIDTVSPELMAEIIGSLGVYKWAWIHMYQRGDKPANEFSIPLNKTTIDAASSIKMYRLPDESLWEGPPLVAYILGTVNGRKNSDPFDFALNTIKEALKGSPVSGFVPKIVDNQPVIVTGQEIEGDNIINTVDKLRDFMAPPRPAPAQPSRGGGGVNPQAPNLGNLGNLMGQIFAANLPRQPGQP